jgi:hypothetical protein
MNRTLRFTGLILASLTISTVAMSQQGGGKGGDGGSGNGGGGDTSVLQVLREDADKARLTRAVVRRHGADCITHACSEPVSPNGKPVRVVRFTNSCAGGETFQYRDYNGQIVRGFCETR